ncbi:MAG: nucleotidyltransferase domain-containing protein [Pseudomonadota bacterium]
MIIDQLREFFHRRDDIVMAILFGSFAMGKENPDSDIDVAVSVVNGKLSSEQIIELVELLAARFGRAIDIVDLAHITEPLRTQILTKGTMLVCRDRSLYESMIKSMWYDQADYIPYRDRILRERRQAWINS